MSIELSIELWQSVHILVLVAVSAHISAGGSQCTYTNMCTDYSHMCTDCHSTDYSHTIALTIVSAD